MRHPLATLLLTAPALFAAAPVLAQQEPITGVYRLTTRAHSDMCLEVRGMTVNANGTIVRLWYAYRTANQQWLVEKQADGAFKIYAFSGRNSLQMLDLTNGNPATGTAVKTWEDNGDDAQRWYIRHVGDGWYRLIPKKAGATSLQTLEVTGGAAGTAGSPTAINVYSGGDNQEFRFDWAGVAKTLPNPKKGMGGRPTKVPYLNGSWFYTWGGDRPPETPTGVEFVPMEWGYYGNANNASVNWLSYVKGQPGVRNLLGFNEPDNTTQANLSVAGALEGWQYMVGTGLALGSPATVHADNQWMKDFMAGCASRNYRVDYVCVHWYGGNDPWGFLGHLDYIHNLYGKPLWVTEFAPADWSGNRGISPQQCADFARIVLPEMNKRDYVQRYAWFSAGTGDAALGAAALVNDDGTLTELGKLYARL